MIKRRPSQQLVHDEYRLQRLIGNDQEWLKECQIAIKTGQVSFLMSDEIAFLLNKDATIPRSEVPGTPTALSIATACANLAALIVDEFDPDDSLSEVLSEFDRCGLGSLASSTSIARDGANTDQPKLSALLTRLHSHHDLHPSSPFATLLVQYLLGHEFKETRSIEVPVLFAKGGTGSVGYLKLQMLKDGPAGLHADPRQMTFLTVDPDFQLAVRDAWSLSPLQHTNACILWTLSETRSGVPIHHVTGSSLGAAWGVALDELASSRFALRFWRRKLDPNCAITARLDGENLKGVTGYDSKIKAAGEHNLRVVVAQEDADRLEGTAASASVNIRGASNVREAIRATRSIANRLALAVSAIVAGIVATAFVTGFIYVGQVSAAETQRVAANLLTAATSMQSADPRKAALYALAADKLAPGTNSREAMFETINANQMVSNSIKVSNQAVQIIEIVDGIIFTSTGDRKLSAWDSKTGKKLWEFKTDSKQIDFTVRSDGKMLATSDKKTVKIYDISGEIPVFKKSFAMNYEVDALKILYTPKMPANSSLIIFTGTEIQTRDDSDGQLRETFKLPSAAIEQPQISATKIGTWHTIAGSTAGLYIVMSDNRIIDWELNKSKYVEIIEPNKIPGTINTVRDQLSYSDNIAVGTSNGVTLVSKTTRSIVSMDFGGVSQALDIAPLFNGSEMGLMVLRNEGLVYLPGNWAESRYRTTINRTGPSQLTALSTDSGDLISPQVEKVRVYAGDNNGKIIAIDALNWKSSRKFLSPSSVAAFASDGDLIQSEVKSGPMHISRLQRIDASVEADDSGQFPIKSEYRTTDFPDVGSIYVNKISVNDEYVAAAGQSREGTGIVLIWATDSGKPIKRIDFPGDDGSSSLSKLPDIVTQVNFVDGGRKLLAFNVKSRVLTTWSTADWSKDSFLHVGGDSSPSLDVSPDGTEILVLSGTKAKRIAVQNLQISSVNDVGNSLGVWYISPDEFVSLDAEQSLSIRAGSTMEISSTMTLPSPATGVSPSPDGRYLALLQRDGSAEVLDTSSLRPITPRLVNQWGGDGVLGAWNAQSTQLAILGRTFVEGTPTVTKTSLWSIGLGTWKEDLCHIAGSDLSDSEWLDATHSGIRKPTLCPSSAPNKAATVRLPNTSTPYASFGFYGNKMSGITQSRTTMIALDPWASADFINSRSKHLYAAFDAQCLSYHQRDGLPVFRCGTGVPTSDLCYQNPTDSSEFACLISEGKPVTTVYSGVRNITNSISTNGRPSYPLGFLLLDGTLCTTRPAGVSVPEPKGYAELLFYCQDRTTIHSRKGTLTSVSPTDRDPFGLGQAPGGQWNAAQQNPQSGGNPAEELAMEIVAISAAYY